MRPDGKVDRDKAIPVLHKAFELGVNLVDTSGVYCNGDSESVIGEALQSWKKTRVYVSTKNLHFDLADEKKWWLILETSLKCLRTDCIDIYNLHGINFDLYNRALKLPDGFYKCALKAKEQGMIKHITMSFHGVADHLVKLADTGEFESVILQYNLLDQQLAASFPHVHQKNMGIIVMGPLAGGRLTNPAVVLSSGIKPVDLALRFVLSNPDVDVAISGMNDVQQVIDNVKIAESREPLSETETKSVSELAGKLDELKKLYCTSCKYCMPCPNEVNISEIFNYLILHKVYRSENDAKFLYSLIGKEGHWAQGKQADSCTECGQCMEKCPQKIDIITQLKESHTKLKV
jgi:hypothetical protein